jgi:two-component system phosphate regulon sensor histidine kinase PhoR
MSRIQSKITLTYILLAVIIIATLGILSSIEIESYVRQNLVKQLSRQADIVLYALRQDSLRSFTELDQMVKEIARRAAVRITLIDVSGTVASDSDVPAQDLPSVENHLGRPEVQEATQKGIGIDTRHSATIGKDFLYVAKRVQHPTTEGVLKSVMFIRLSMHLEDLQKINREIRSEIFVAGLIVLVLVFGVSALVSRRISGPMADIARNVQEIRSGNLDKHIESSSNDEIRVVAHAINELVEKLKVDIEQLKKLERVRSEFLGNVSHELRTPIFALQGFLETLLDGAIDDPQVNRDFLEKAHVHAARLNTLLSDLINISQIESGEMKMSFRYFAVSDFLEQVVSEMMPLAQQNGITLTLQKPGVEVEAYGDKERLKQVMVNLIANAVKYNKPAGRVAVAYERVDGNVKISVKDTGVGIAQEHLPRIFERFYRVDKERSREAGGTGLGLAIVKHIVEAHGSKVEVESRATHGSTFSFSLKT